MPAECHRQCTTWGHGQLCQPPAVLWQTASAAGQGNVVTAGEAELQTAPTAPEPWVLLLSPGACTSRKVHVSQPSHVLQWGHWPSSLGLGVGSTGLCSCDWRPALGFPAPLSHVPRVLPGPSSPGSNWSHLEGSRGSLLSRLSLPATAAGCPWRGSGRCSSPRPPIQHLRCWTPRSLSKAPRQTRGVWGWAPSIAQQAARWSSPSASARAGSGPSGVAGPPGSWQARDTGASGPLASQAKVDSHFCQHRLKQHKI